MRSHIKSVFANLFRRNRVDQDLDDELRAYVDLATDEARGAGLSDDEARRAALVELGGVEQVRESIRDARAGAVIDQLRQDFVYAIRMLGRNRGLHRRRRPDPRARHRRQHRHLQRRRRRRVPAAAVPGAGSAGQDLGQAARGSRPTILLARFRRHPRSARCLRAGRGGRRRGVTLTRGRPRERSAARIVTGNWLSTLGVQPFLGRAFAAGRRCAGRAIASCFSRTPAGSGASTPTRASSAARSCPTTAVYTIIGVLPPNVLRYGADFLRPLVPPRVSADGRVARDLDVFARLQARRDDRAGAGRARQRSRGGSNASTPAIEHGARLRVAPLGRYYALDRRQGERRPAADARRGRRSCC